MTSASPPCEQEEDENDEDWGEMMKTIPPTVITRMSGTTKWQSHKNGTIHCCHPDDEDEDQGTMTTTMLMIWTARTTGTTNTVNKATRMMRTRGWWRTEERT